MIGVGAAGFVPFAFIDADHFAGVAGDAAVGEEVGRVGEDEVDGRFGDLGEEVEAVAEVDAEVVLGVVESGGGKSGGGFGHDDDRSGWLIRWAMESSGGGGAIKGEGADCALEKYCAAPTVLANLTLTVP